jgi:hypothetical protein
MADIYCDICREHDELTPATIEFCVQRQDDPDATPQHVRCCERHKERGKVVAELMRSNMAPAVLSSRSLGGASA